VVGVHRAAAPAARVARQVEVARELEPGELGHLGRVRLRSGRWAQGEGGGWGWGLGEGEGWGWACG
jgi:hypothetical protein